MHTACPKARHIKIYVCMYVCVYMCICVCIYIYIYIYIYLHTHIYGQAPTTSNVGETKDTFFLVFVLRFSKFFVSILLRVYFLSAFFVLGETEDAATRVLRDTPGSKKQAGLQTASFSSLPQAQVLGRVFITPVRRAIEFGLQIAAAVNCVEHP